MLIATVNYYLKYLRKTFYLTTCRAMKKGTLCLKACWNRNKCFRNIKAAIIFGLAQSYLIYIAYINLL